MTRLLSFILAALGTLCGVANAQISTEEATFKLLQSPEAIREGYARQDWPFKENLWMEAIECWGGRTLMGARSTCLVCSIDDTSGQDYFRMERGGIVGRIQPSTSVGVQASYAYFQLQPKGWTLLRFKPFSVNFYANSREPHHRANVRNLSMGTAQLECRDMEAVSGTE